jgi:diacylglycerol kinase
MIFHFAAAIIVVLINFRLNITKMEWLITLILIGLAWMAEILNTSIEKLADSVSKDHHPLIGQAKDLASGAVLVICLVAAVCGIVIYVPYVW